MKSIYLAAVAVAALSLFVAPNLSACVSNDTMMSYHGGGDETDLNDYGALFIDAGDPGCAKDAMTRLTKKLESHLASSSPFQHWGDGYYVALIYGAALRLGEQGWAMKDLDWQLDYSPDESPHATVANKFMHVDSGSNGVPACNPDGFNTCMDDFAGSAAGYAWMAVYKSRRVMPGHNTTDDVKAALGLAALHIHNSLSQSTGAICIRKLPLDDNTRLFPICDGTIDMLTAGTAQTLSVNGTVQLIHYGFGLMTSVLSAAQGYEIASATLTPKGGPIVFSPSEIAIAKGLYDEIVRHTDTSGNFLPPDCLKLVGGVIEGNSPCDGSFIGDKSYAGSAYEPNMYQLKGAYDKYFPRVIPDESTPPEMTPYISNNFQIGLFPNVSDPKDHFGYGRLATYRDMGGYWIPGGNPNMPSDGPPNMPSDVYDPLPGSLSISPSGYATGWTCDQDAPNGAIEVDFYTGDLWPPVYVLPVATTYANLASESAVNSACSPDGILSGGTAHRFAIQLPPQAAGLAIHAFGLDYTWYGFTELLCSSGTVCSFAACSTATITAQPVSSPGSIASGESSTLTIGVSGTSPTIQWYTSSGTYVGSGSSITVSPTTTTTYYATVGNSCTSTFPSANVTVSVSPTCITATITAQPVSNPGTIGSGGSSTLTIGVSGTSPTIQWYTSSGTYIGSGTYCAVSPTTNTTYYAIVSNSCTSPIQSANVSVIVVPCSPPVIVMQPAGSTIASGQTATLSLSASGSQPLSIQWFTALGAPAGTGATITVSPAETTGYYATVSNSCGSVNTQTVTITVSVCAAPVITSQPQGLSVFFGSTATLSVTATVTTATPLTYQWYVGDSGTTTSPISGATSSSYTTPPLTTDTSYWVAVSSDICGPTLSDAAIVSICPLPPTMPAAPDQTIRLGQTAHVELAPFSPPTGNTFFWYQGASGDTSNPLGDFTGDWGPYDYIDVSPAVTTQYWAQIKNGSCVANTGTTTISVCIPTITQQPTGLMINGGQSTTLTVVANTPGLTYQWYTGASGNTSSPISGATNASYIASPTVTTSYWVRVTGLCAQSADSNTATITICQPPSAISLSGGGEIVRGQSMTLFASSTGTGITYQWYQGSASDTSTPIYNGAQSITVNPQSLTNYWVRVSGTCGSRDSATVTVNVCAAPTITSQPQSVSVFSGGTTTLSVSASVATATPLTYQWYIGASGTTSSPISGATSSSYTTPALTTDTSYWVAVSSDICGPTLSDAATVSICPLPPTMTGAPSQSISLGQTAHLVIPPFSPSTGDTYFWYQGAAGDTSHPLGDYSGDWGPYNYIDVSPAVTTQYWAQIKNGTCIASTGTTTVSVCIPTITQQPASLMINSGQTTTLTVAANTAGLTYHWYQGASGNTSVPVGTNSPTFTTPALTATTSYWVLVTGTCGQSVSSNTATVTICQTPAITVQPAGTSLVRGYSTTLSVSATGTGLSYQWYLGTSGNTSNPLAGNTNSYTVTNPQNPVDYWVKVSGTCGTAVNSATAHISVCTTPTINTQPQSSYTFSGGSATLSVSASEATGETLHYQWHKGTTSPVNVGTDSPTYNTGALSAVTSYYVTVTAGTAGLCSVDSAAATVSICTYPQTVTGAPNANTSPGQSVRLTITPNYGVTSYLWYRGVSGDTSNPMGGWQAANYVDVAPTTTTSYWAQWQADSGSCISNTTTTTVSVCIPVITTQPANVTIASGSTTLSVVSNLPGSTYQWYVGASGTTTSPISGATSASVTVSPGTTTSYWCRVSGSCATANSNTATVTICSPPAITHQPTNSVAQSGQLNVLTVTATGTNLTYQWYMGASGDTSNPMSGRTTSTLQNNLTSSVQYWVKVSGTCGSVNSSAAWMSVPPGILSQPQQTTYVAQGSKGNLFVNAAGTGLHYQWWGDSGPVAGAPDSPNFISPDVNATADYYCIITSSGGAQTTSWTGTFYLCTGVPINSTTVTNAGGNCRNLISNVAGSYNNMTWYQGQRGDTSVQVGTNYYLSVCPSTSTTYWFRVFNTDSSQGVSCYTDSATSTVP
ncbi:MAG TPA: hypothetical protein VLC46_22510 [Thermoanaerobaculia bacterium]|jgi:hypothetical protein|nr:hypothetical protein [Thermoanaerobaculia bacterium]